jgi:methionyl aminopeptidase
MILLKSAQEIKIMKAGGRRLAGVMKVVLGEVKPGMSLREIDSLAEKLIRKQGGQPSFKMVKGYHWATCLNVNQGVVHGVPTDYRLKREDIFSLDMGLFYQGFHTDMARTIRIDRKESVFLKAGAKALVEATKAAKPGNRVGHLSLAIEKEIKKRGLTPVQALVGHGVGRRLHEAPQIPGYLHGKLEKTEKLKLGMTLAIEIIYTQGKPDVRVKDDGWTVETIDGQLAALFEDTVAVGDQGAQKLTQV